MKKMKWLGATGAVLALGAVGFIGTSSAGAASVTITAGHLSHVNCTVVGGAKLSPTLANPWLQSAHSGSNADSNANATVKAAVASITDDQTWMANGGANTVVTTSAKTTATCDGSSTVTDGTNTTGVASATITATSLSTGSDPATCSGLADTSGTTFTAIVAWKGTGTAKIAPTTINAPVSALFDSHGVGFDLVASSITGSFAGGSSETKAYVDTNTISAIASAPPTYDSPTADSVCEPSISEKFTPAAPGTSDAIALKLKKPKGLKGIVIGPALDNTASSFTASR